MIEDENYLRKNYAQMLIKKKMLKWSYGGGIDKV